LAEVASGTVGTMAAFAGRSDHEQDRRRDRERDQGRATSPGRNVSSHQSSRFVRGEDSLVHYERVAQPAAPSGPDRRVRCHRVPRL
jgi:hypothetical protein